MTAIFNSDPAVVITAACAGYVLIALLLCRVLGFNTHQKAAAQEAKPGQTTLFAAAKAATNAVRPDCRAKPLMYTAEFAQCVTENHAGCRHILNYGRVTFCYHPKREEIVKQTKASPGAS